MVQEEATKDNYRPLVVVTEKERFLIEKAARLTRRRPNHFISKSAVDCAKKVVENHEITENNGVEEALL